MSVTTGGRDMFKSWYGSVKDRKARFAILDRILYVHLGNFGDHKPLNEGVWELLIDFGPGYRLYYAMDQKTVVL